jgi:S1-C subfamily serine protease
MPQPRKAAAAALWFLAALFVPALHAADVLYSTGTGFEVSDSGHFLTNHHVVTGCKDIHLKHGGLVDEASILADDAAHDLALLVDSRRVLDRMNFRRLLKRGIPYARFRDDTAFLALGESVMAVGYPLQDVLAGINATTGIVSSTSGPGGTPERFQITAPIQPGNSGGPVLDDRGRVIGVVVAQLAREYEQKTGIQAQNVNFAIQGKVARDFVRRTIGDPPPEEAPAQAALDTATLANRASEYTFMVLCRQ